MTAKIQPAVSKLPLDDATPAPLAGASAQGMASRGPGSASFLQLWLAVMALPYFFGLGWRYFDRDEFQHVQMAWLIGKGLVPFRDFFEHHTPLFHLLAAPLMALVKPELEFNRSVLVLLLLRLGCILVTFLSAWATYRLARRAEMQEEPALVAATLFLGCGIVLQKGQEIRPDVPAALLVLLGCMALLARRPPVWRAVGVGLCCGLAIAFTQKVLLLLPGFALGFAWSLLAGRASPRDWAMSAGAGIVAALLPLLLLLGGFAALGAGHVLVQDTLVQNVGWLSYRSVGEALMPVLIWSPVTAASLLLGAGLMLGLAMHRPLPRGAPLLPVVASGIGGMFVLPVFFEQYLMLFTGPAAVIGAVLAARLAPVSRLALPALAIAAGLQGWAMTADRIFAFQFHDLRVLEEMHAQSGPRDAALGAWTVQFPFRMPATRRTFLNGEVCYAIGPEERAAILAAVTSRPDVRVATPEVATCLNDPQLAAALAEHFAPTGVAGVLVRRD